MLWLSTILIIGFGSLTVFLGDPVWIQIKPTAIYLLFAAVLFGGLLRGKANAAPPAARARSTGFRTKAGASSRATGRGSSWFLAGLNEVLRHDPVVRGMVAGQAVGCDRRSRSCSLSAQIPMLLKHGLGEEGESEVEQNPPSG